MFFGAINYFVVYFILEYGFIKVVSSEYINNS